MKFSITKLRNKIRQNCVTFYNWKQVTLTKNVHNLKEIIWPVTNSEKLKY